MKNLMMMIIVFALFSLNSMKAERIWKPIANHENGNIEWLISKDLLIQDFENAWNIDISNMEIDYNQSTSVESYLLINATDNVTSESIAIAIGLTGETSPNSGDDIYIDEDQGIAEKHSCIGQNCVLCGFVTSGGGISGCNCEVIGDPTQGSPPSICNHSVEYISTLEIIILLFDVLSK